MHEAIYNIQSKCSGFARCAWQYVVVMAPALRDKHLQGMILLRNCCGDLQVRWWLEDRA